MSEARSLEPQRALYQRADDPVVPFISDRPRADVDPFIPYEKERNRIAQRTREALAAAKARGQQLGDPDIGRLTRAGPTGTPNPCGRS